MPHWRDTIRSTATFRGVEFLVDTYEQSGGHRGPDHEFPGKNDPPFAEDLGLEGRVFPVEGFVLGAEYVTERDALLAALEKEGPGELNHPAFGTRTVIARKWRVRESQADGGIAKFSIEFHETSTPLQPAATSDGPAKVTSAASVAQTSVDG